MKHDYNLCFSCGLKHPKVDGGGLWGCPNLLCTGCGVTNRIIALCDKSAVVETASGYEVDEREIRRVQLAWARTLDDEALGAFLRERYPTFMREVNGELTPVIDRDTGDEHAERP